MKPSVERALALLGRTSFSGVAEFKRWQAFNRDFVNPGRNPYGHGIGDIDFDGCGQFDYWTEDDAGIIRHYLFRVEENGEVAVEEMEIREDEL